MVLDSTCPSCRLDDRDVGLLLGLCYEPHNHSTVGTDCSYYHRWDPEPRALKSVNLLCIFVHTIC